MFVQRGCEAGLARAKRRERARALEIGSLRGRVACWHVGIAVGGLGVESEKTGCYSVRYDSDERSWDPVKVFEVRTCGFRCNDQPLRTVGRDPQQQSPERQI